MPILTKSLQIVSQSSNCAHLMIDQFGKMMTSLRRYCQIMGALSRLQIRIDFLGTRNNSSSHKNEVLLWILEFHIIIFSQIAILFSFRKGRLTG